MSSSEITFSPSRAFTLLIYSMGLIQELRELVPEYNAEDADKIISEINDLFIEITEAQE